MDNLPEIVERIHQALEARTRARDQALAQARALTRFSAHAIRAIHRGEHAAALENLAEGRKIFNSLRESLAPFPELFYAGYTQDAIKELAEANLTVALVENQPLPTPEELEVEYATYLNGLAEAAGELRRRCLDIIRAGYNPEADRLLACMDEIYETLVTMDYPDAVTNGLRRQTDVARSLLERTRGDLTISVREQQLERRMRELSEKLECADTPEMDDSQGFTSPGRA
jgi:translin